MCMWFCHNTDGELYSGTAADFMGRDFAIFRTLGHHHPIRTEQHDSRWLNGTWFMKENRHITYVTVLSYWRTLLQYMQYDLKFSVQLS